MKRLRKILTLSGILWAFCLTCKAQIIREGDRVSMPLNTYRIWRIEKLKSDTLLQLCDSIQQVQSDRIALKDSIISIKDHKIALKDSIIVEKNNTIKLLSEVPKSKTPKLVPILAIISVAEFFLLILAIK